MIVVSKTFAALNWALERVLWFSYALVFVLIWLSLSIINIATPGFYHHSYPEDFDSFARRIWDRLVQYIK